MRAPVPAPDRAWIEIDRAALIHNAGILQGAMPAGCRLMAVVKANGYGHGAAEAAGILERSGVRAFAVATIDEGIALRKAGIRGMILILGWTDPARARELRRYDLTQTVISLPYAEALDRQGETVKVHCKVDTGMHRLGLDWDDVPAMTQVFAMRSLRIRGLYTHLACADSRTKEDDAFTREQIRRFVQLTATLKNQGLPVPKLHIQSSYGLLNYPHLKCDYARIGIALYGVPSDPSCSPARKLSLRPVLSLKARVALLRDVPRGEAVGYGRAFLAGRDSRIAVLSIGYADGYPRSLSNGAGWVVLNGRRCPVAGRVCMDQLAVDVTEAEDVAVGDAITLFGPGGPAAADIARAAGTISNELLSRLGPRLPVLIRGKTEAVPGL